MNDGRFDGFDLSFFGYIVSGGDSANADLEERFDQFLQEHGAQVKLTRGYGMSEMVTSGTLTMPNCNKPGSVGIPMSKTTVKIVEPGTDRELGYREDGEICFASPAVMLGYYQNVAATDAIIRIDAEGVRWLHTGDLGYVTEDGVLYHRGRLKRLMITYFGPEHTPQKVFPDRIEAVLTAHPAVIACAAVGVPHSEYVNVPKAYLMLAKGFEPDSRLYDELFEYCQANLPEFSVPHAFAFVSEFPRTHAGKVDYRALERR